MPQSPPPPTRSVSLREMEAWLREHRSHGLLRVGPERVECRRCRQYVEATTTQEQAVLDRVILRPVDLWRRLIRSRKRDPEVLCFVAVSYELQRVLADFPREPGELESEDVRNLARRLAETLVFAALAKLATRFPKDVPSGGTQKGWTRLIHYRANEAFADLTQAVEWGTELLYRDLAARPRDRLTARVVRVTDAIKNCLFGKRGAEREGVHGALPSWRGRRTSRASLVYELWLLARYDAWRAALEEVFPARTWTDMQPEDREALLAEQQAAGGLPESIPADLLHKACAVWSRAEAARTIIAETAPAVRVTPAYLRDLLRRTRALARKLDSSQP